MPSPTSPSSSARRALEELGRRLRDLRKDARLTGRDLARLADWHESKVSKIEHGKQTPTDSDLDAWARYCGRPDEADDLIAALRAVEGMYVEWRRIERAGLRRAQETADPLFERTRQFRAYSSWLIPGLFQTAPYTRAILHATAQRRELGEDVDAAVAVRMERQQVLYRGRRRFAVLIEEATLRTVIGGPSVMAGQLGHLLTVGSLPSVSLGIVPSSIDRSAMRPVEDFWIFGEEHVNVELVSAWLTITQPADLELYARVFARLADLAVYGAAARALIAAALESVEQTGANS